MGGLLKYNRLNKEQHKEIINRLAQIKYLFKIGIEQSMQVEAIAWSSILTLHDSIEIFLKLLVEYQNIESKKSEKSKNTSFLGHWEIIDSLTLKESMRSLNTRRVNIKHHGLLPSKSDIEMSRFNAIDFFEQNTFSHFGIEWKDISLLTLIEYENVREELEKAQKSLEENKIEDCLKFAAVAFDRLIFNYEKNKWVYRNSPFDFIDVINDLSHFDKSTMEILDYKNISDFINQVRESFDRIQKVVKIISLGIDYKKFIKFNILTPSIAWSESGDYLVQSTSRQKVTKENCQYCIDFVIDNSLKFQEFDFDIRELVGQPPMEN